MLQRMWRNQAACAGGGGVEGCGRVWKGVEGCGMVWNSAAAVRNRPAGPHRVKRGAAVGPTNSTLQYVTKGAENTRAHKHPYTDVHSSVNHNNQKVETTLCPSTDEWVNKM